MAIIKCKSGHFYDDSLYHGKCPHCKAQMELLKSGNDVVEDDKTVAMTAQNISILTNVPSEEKTQPVEAPADITGQSDESGKLADIMEELLGEKLGEMPEEEKDKTISLFGGALGVQPVTGWLVCINGTESGKDYRLHAGKNFVGRSMAMDVSIVGDKSVARNKHCSVVYEPNGNTFYVSSEAGNVVYLNDKTVESYTEVLADDILKIGETELVLVPYCKEDRRWESET